jgi:GT2 family glycosyltransferase
MDPLLYIIIPVFNRYAFTKACLESLQNQTVQNFKVIVVDDGSTDNTLTDLPILFPEVHLLTTSGDTFWTNTINVGIKYALAQGAPYILTLNNDVLCPSSFTAAFTTQLHTHPEALQGALALGPDGSTIAYAGENWFWPTDVRRPLKGISIGNETSNDLLNSPRPLKSKEDKEILKPVSHFPARGLLVPASVFARIGLFDTTTFPHYMADYDFTLRARKAGYTIYLNTTAHLITYPEVSGDRALRKSKSIANYVRHLTGIRGGGNVQNFLRFSLRHCPPALLPQNLLIGLSKRLVGYWLK